VAATSGASSLDALPAATPVVSGRVVAAVAVTVTAWASAFVAIRGVRDSFDPGALALGRLLIGSIALGLVLLARRTWIRPTGREWALIGLCGVAWFAVYNVALNAAEQRVDAGSAAMVVNVGPILIALLAGALLGEGFPRWLLIGAGIAFGGAVVIGAATAHTAGSDVGGVLLCLLAATAWAIGVLAQKPALRRLPALQVTQMACTVGAIACLPFAWRLAHDLPHASHGDIAGVVYLGLVPTAIAFCTWAYALSRMPAGRLGVTTYLVPPLTIAVAWPTLGERPPLLALAGGVLALVGISLSRRRR
jgi:drug/metabolite transporter (DMT)-like permease